MFAVFITVRASSTYLIFGWFLLCFQSFPSRDVVYRMRFRLTGVDAKRPLDNIFVNEDLTSTRASLAADARSLKKAAKIADTWTYNGNILIKNGRNEIVQVRVIADLTSFTNQESGNVYLSQNT